MSRIKYKRVLLPILLLVIIGSVTSCFMFFMDWSGEGGLTGTWIYTNTAINETVTLVLTADTFEIKFDEDNPVYTSVSNYFDDWEIRGNLSVDENIMNISIYEIYRYYSQWYYYTTPTPPTYEWRSITGGNIWRNNLSWPTYWTNTPVQYPNFFNYYPANNLGADYASRNLNCTYLLDGNSLVLTFTGGTAGSFEFTRQ